MDSDHQVGGGRKRQLNLIYFVDAARTHTVAISLGKLRVLLVVVLSILTWSIASIAVITWLSRDMDTQASRLRAAQSTIFEYETRYDGVYDIAYPPGGKPNKAVVKAAAKTAVVSAAPEVAPAQAIEPAPATSVVTSASAPQETAAPLPEPKTSKDTEGLGIVVSNPVLEAADHSLELRFDLTNNRSPERVEGYIWAIAAFKTTNGEIIYVGAPDAIQVKSDGDPTFPQRATIFGIRHFKKKAFTFPFVKGKQGSFTGIRIGLMDRSGKEKNTYNVPVDIKVGDGASLEGGTSEKKSE